MSSLVVNTNLPAIQTLNDLDSTDTSMTTAINRLSSGLQIQNAATGPAQYVISQALESQANGYSTAIDNAQDGVSLIQTASGALTQISTILQTMDQLALTSANGATLTSTSSAANSAEFNDLLTEITRIAETTTFGTTQLLVGSGTPGTAYSGELQVGAFDTVNDQVTLSISAVTSKSLALSGSGNSDTSAKVTAAFTVTAATLTITVGTGTAVAVTVKTATSLTDIADAINSNATLKGEVTASVATGKLSITTVKTGATAPALTVGTLAVTTGGTTPVNLFATATGAKVTAAGTTAVTIATPTKAAAAVKVIQAALSTVDSVASSVGATQDELQAIVSNLTVGQQNLQSADSQLVDVNMAQEMTTYTTDEILMNTGISMLAQAQQTPSLVEKLI